MDGQFDQDGVEAEAARWFFHNSDEIFIVMRRGVVAWVNPTWTQLLGWTAEETAGRPLTDFAHPDEEGLIAEAIRRLQTQNDSSAEHRLTAKSGGHLWFRSRGVDYDTPNLEEGSWPRIVPTLRRSTLMDD